MKLVIDIPRKVNERIRADYGHGYIPYDEDQRAIMEAIYNGKKVEETSKFAKGKDALISRQAAKSTEHRMFFAIYRICHPLSLN